MPRTRQSSVPRREVRQLAGAVHRVDTNWPPEQRSRPAIAASRRERVTVAPNARHQINRAWIREPFSVRDRCTSTRRDPLPSVCCSREHAAWSQPADPCYRKPREKEASPMALASLPPRTIGRSPHRCRPTPATHAQQQAPRPDAPAAAIAFIDPALTYARSRWRRSSRAASRRTGSGAGRALGRQRDRA